MANDLKTTHKRDMARLRRRMDGNDPFMSAHQIKKIRTREREIPAWTLNDKEVQKVLLRSFPTLRRTKAAAAQAGRWMRLIHLYYRVQMPNSQVAKEMGMTLNAVKMALKGIRRVSRGRNAKNTAVLGLRPRWVGRPKKK